MLCINQPHLKFIVVLLWQNSAPTFRAENNKFLRAKSPKGFCFATDCIIPHTAPCVNTEFAFYKKNFIQNNFNQINLRYQFFFLKFIFIIASAVITRKIPSIFSAPNVSEKQKYPTTAATTTSIVAITPAVPVSIYIRPFV